MGISADDALRVMAETAREGGSVTATARGLVAMDRFQRAVDEIRYAPASIDPGSVARLSRSLSDFDCSGEIKLDDDAYAGWQRMVTADPIKPTVTYSSSPSDGIGAWYKLMSDTVAHGFKQGPDGQWTRTRGRQYEGGPYTHTFQPGEPKRQNRWQFWRRRDTAWATYTVSRESKRLRWRTVKTLGNPRWYRILVWLGVLHSPSMCVIDRCARHQRLRWYLRLRRRDRAN
jgi:hypothetical protein